MPPRRSRGSRGRRNGTGGASPPTKSSLKSFEIKRPYREPITVFDSPNHTFIAESLYFYPKLGYAELNNNGKTMKIKMLGIDQVKDAQIHTDDNWIMVDLGKARKIRVDDTYFLEDI